MLPLKNLILISFLLLMSITPCQADDSEGYGAKDIPVIMSWATETITNKAKKNNLSIHVSERQRAQSPNALVTHINEYVATRMPEDEYIAASKSSIDGELGVEIKITEVFPFGLSKTEINKILKSKGLIARSYKKQGKITIIETNDGKYIYKEGKLNPQILNYLKSRSFDYLPFFLNNENDPYQLETYIESLDIPDEQKILDLIRLIALLHSKTTHYKEIDLDYYEQIYDDLDNNLNYLYLYYTDLITLIETKVYMSPSEQLLARNISKIYDTIDRTKQRLDKWHTNIKEKRKQRRVVLHNNLKLEHFLESSSPYLISWDKAKIGSPVFDLYKLYQNHALDFDFETLLNEYEKNYPLKKDEKELLFILISLPDLINFQNTEYQNCKEISKMLDKLYKTENLISPKEPKNSAKQ